MAKEYVSPEASGAGRPALLWPAGAPIWQRLLIPTIILTIAQYLAGLSTPAGHRFAIVPLAGGVSLIWLSHFVHQVRFWRIREFWLAAGLVVCITVPVLWLRGFDVLISLISGVGLLVQSTVTALVWSRWLARDGRRPALIAQGRVLLACFIGSFSGLPFAPWIAFSERLVDNEHLGFWLMCNTVCTFVVGVVTYLLIVGGWSRTARVSRLVGSGAIALMTFALGAILISGSDPWVLFLCVPVGVLAASILSIRGVAAFSGIVSVEVVVLAVRELGPFSQEVPLGSATLMHLFVLVFVFVNVVLVLDRGAQTQLLAQVAQDHAVASAHVEFFERMVHAISDGVAVVDGNGTVVMSNSAAQERLARLPCHRGGLWGHGCDSPVSRVLAGADSASADLQVSAVVGRPPAVFSLRAYPVEWDGHRLAVAVISDVTPERNQTTDLQRFARMAAHDMRSPLTAMSLWAETAEQELRSGDPQSALVCLGHIVRTTGNMDRLIANLLDHSVASYEEPRRTPVRLVDLVSSATEAKADVYRSAGMQLNLAVPASTIVDVDPRLLTRVLDNLLDNAVKYAVPGRAPQLDVSCVQDAPGRVTLRVEDRGIGIPRGQEEAVFEEFHRVAEHTTGRPGSGLGLAFCRQVVERHGGRITATPRSGGGTRFELTLPVWAGLPETTGKAASASAEERLAPPKVRRGVPTQLSVA